MRLRLIALCWLALLCYPAVAVGQCAPELRLGGVSGGGRVLMLSAPTVGCPCTFLRLDICSDRGEPLERSDPRCQQGGAQWWSAARVLPWDSDSNLTNAVSTEYLAGWYRTLCCRGRRNCCFSDGIGTPVWLDGLRVESWNVTVSLIQSSGAPRLSVAFRQWEPHAPEGFYLPRLLVTATGPGRYFSQTLVDVSNHRVNVSDDNANVQDADVNVEDAAAKLPDAEVNLPDTGENVGRKRRSRTMSDSVDGDGPVSPSTELSNSEGGVLGKPGNGYAARQWHTIEFESDDGGDGLSPGNYTVLFRPADGVTFNCDGLADGCPLLSAATVLVPKLEPAPPKPLPPRPKGRIYGGVAGGCLAVLVVGAAATCFLLRRRAGALIAAGKRVVACAALQQQQRWLPAPSPVLLLHGSVNSASERTALSALATELRAGGVRVVDGAQLRRQFLRDGSIAPLLDSNNFHSARLLFVSTGDSGGSANVSTDGVGRGAGRGVVEGSVESQMYSSAVRYVRAGHLALNYGRVFTGRLSGADARELAGLCEGRLFTLPEHAPLLLEHLTAPAATAIEGGGSEALTAGPPSETTPLSAAAIP